MSSRYQNEEEIKARIAELCVDVKLCLCVGAGRGIREDLAETYV